MHKRNRKDSKVGKISRTSKINKAKGFTIIEVMIVLAIAGTIMAIIFLAIPPMQRGLRNRNRGVDAALLITTVNEYYSNNFSTPPPNCTGQACPFWTKQELSQFDISNVFFFNAPATTTHTDYITNDPDTIYIVRGAGCAPGSKSDGTPNSDVIASNWRVSNPRRSSSAVYQVEGGGPAGQYDYTSPNWNKNLRRCVDVPF